MVLDMVVTQRVNAVMEEAFEAIGSQRYLQLYRSARPCRAAVTVLNDRERIASR
jgi:hypothetical protein